MKAFALLLIPLIVLTACQITVQSTQPQERETVRVVVPMDPTDEEQAGITLSEVAQHSTSYDCWIAINGKVYDVAQFVERHPGGEALLEGCGRDSTTLYETRPMGSGTPHSDKARGLLDIYYIGELAGAP